MLLARAASADAANVNIFCGMLLRGGGMFDVGVFSPAQLDALERRSLETLDMGASPSLKALSCTRTSG